jgi:hypothetical protein
MDSRAHHRTSRSSSQRMSTRGSSRGSPEDELRGPHTAREQHTPAFSVTSSITTNAESARLRDAHHRHQNRKHSPRGKVRLEEANWRFFDASMVLTPIQAAVPQPPPLHSGAEMKGGLEGASPRERDSPRDITGTRSTSGRSLLPGISSAFREPLAAIPSVGSGVGKPSAIPSLPAIDVLKTPKGADLALQDILRNKDSDKKKDRDKELSSRPKFTSFTPMVQTPRPTVPVPPPGPQSVTQSSQCAIQNPISPRQAVAVNLAVQDRSVSKTAVPSSVPLPSSALLPINSDPFHGLPPVSAADGKGSRKVNPYVGYAKQRHQPQLWEGERLRELDDFVESVPPPMVRVQAMKASLGQEAAVPGANNDQVTFYQMRMKSRGTGKESVASDENPELGASAELGESSTSHQLLLKEAESKDNVEWADALQGTPFLGIRRLVTHCTNTFLAMAPLQEGESLPAEDDLEVRIGLRRLNHSIHPVHEVSLATDIPSLIAGRVVLTEKNKVIYPVTVEHDAGANAQPGGNGLPIGRDLDYRTVKSDPNMLFGAGLPEDREERLAYLRARQKEAEAYFGFRGSKLTNRSQSHSTAEA